MVRKHTNERNKLINNVISTFRDLSFNNNNVEFKKKHESLHSLVDESYDGSKFDNNDVRHYVDKKSIKIIPFLKSLLEIKRDVKYLGEILTFVSSGSNGIIFKESGGDYAIKIVFYDKKYTQNNKYKNGIYQKSIDFNSEILILKKLSYLVREKKTPHLINPLISANVDLYPVIYEISRLLKHGKLSSKRRNSLEKIIDKFKNKKFLFSTCSMILVEYAPSGDLLDFLRNVVSGKIKIELSTWKNILFQIIYTLYIIQSYYPGFRHNDLKANNILMSRFRKSRANKYKIKDIKYPFLIPSCEYVIYIWDFDFSAIEGQINNEKVSSSWTNKFNIHNKRNDYYDIHYLINSLKTFIPDLYRSQNVPSEIKDFFRKIVPRQYSGKDVKNTLKNNRLLINDVWTTPKRLLKDDFFEDFLFKS